MNQASKIFVAGHNGLVGSAITKSLREKGYTNLIFRTLKELDLTDQNSVNRFFAEEQPEYVFLAAALVGGIIANNNFRADFIYQNIMIQSNVIYAAWKSKVRKLLFLGSTCIYPKSAPQPLKEEYLLTSELEFTNEPYAIAKIAGLKMCESFNYQYNTNFIAVMPTNLYGPGDNFNLEKSHVLPALLRKIHLGKCLEDENLDAIKIDLNKNPVDGISGESDIKSILGILKKYGIDFSDELNSRDDNVLSAGEIKDSRKVTVTVWGTGSPFREFMYSDDMANACVFIMENVNVDEIIRLKKEANNSIIHPPHFLNIGTGEEISIKELALTIKKLIGFRGDIVFDTSKPDGTFRKTTDTSILKHLGYRYNYDLHKGLEATYKAYLNN